MSTPVKVRFALDRDRDGWPPAESEALWALPVEGDLYRLDNTPWFKKGIAPDDVVKAHPDSDGVLWFAHVREHGGRVVVPVIPRADGPLGGDRQAVLDAFEPFGVGDKGMASPVNEVALDIGPDAPLSSRKPLLVAQSDQPIASHQNRARNAPGCSPQAVQARLISSSSSTVAQPSATARLTAAG